jgi:predicted secreted acid phosphatase
MNLPHRRGAQFCVAFLFLYLAAIPVPLLGQSGLAPAVEPENHAITVDRLMRYHDSGEYERQIREVANAAREYLEKKFPEKSKNEKVAAVFDIDETSLSNWDVMAECGFCAYSVQAKLHPDPHGPAIAPVLELYDFAKSKGIALFFITGRPEKQRQLTIDNLREAGYEGWADLIMQPDTAAGAKRIPARIFKPRNRLDIEKRGYRIVLSIGDQASDLAGCCAERVFKLPNPFYLVE